VEYLIPTAKFQLQHFT